MAWLLLLLLAGLVVAAMWRWARLNKPVLQLVAAGLLLGMAGYAWQGSPGLAGKPVPPRERQSLPDTPFAQTRESFLGSFDRASPWLNIADSYHRSGDTKSAVDVIKAGLREMPKEMDLWIGLGNALVLHAGGLMTPAAELAFSRAAQVAPNHPAPRFFYGLALAQGGRLDEAEQLWQSVLASAPATAQWRPVVERQLAMIELARRMAASDAKR